MTQQQWEFCELSIDNWKYDKKKQTWSYSVWIWYHAPDGKTLHQVLATLDKPSPFNPWRKALGLLGGAGWELVTVQHGNTFGGTSPHGFPGDITIWENALLHHDRVAYLKRVAVPGRAVNEPQLAL